MSNTVINFTVFSDKDYQSFDRTGPVNNSVSFAVNSPLNSYSTVNYNLQDQNDVDFINRTFASQSKSPSGILPPGVVALDDCIIIFEAPPKMAYIEHCSVARDNIRDDTPMTSSYIPVPWQTYVIIHDKNYNLIDTYMYYNKRPISQYGYDEPVFLPVLPNFYSSGLLCRPFYASADDVNMYSKDQAGVISAAYDAVWNSGWNADLMDTVGDFFTDINKKYSYGHSSMVEHFQSNNKEDFLTSIKMPMYINRDMYFFTYAKIVKDLDVLDGLHIVYPFPSKSHIRANYIDQLRDEIREEYYSYAEENEDDVDDDDMSSYVDDKISEIIRKPVPFEEMLHYILHVRTTDLNIIDPVSNNYFDHVYKSLSNFSNSNQNHVQVIYENEPF